MALAPPAPISFQWRLRLVNDLLTFNSADIKMASGSRQRLLLKLASVLPANPSTVCKVLLFSHARKTAVAPSVPISFWSKLAEVNALLTRKFNGQKCSTDNKFVSIGRMHTKHNSNSKRATGGDTYDCGNASAMALTPPDPIQ